MDGRMVSWTIFLRLIAQGMWYDRHGRRVHPKANAQVAGLGPSGYAPVTSELHIGSERYRENERFKKEEYDRINKDIAEENVEQFEKLKASVSARK